MASPAAEAFAAKHNAEVAAKKLAEAPKSGDNSVKANVRPYLERLVALEREKKTLNEDIRELKAEADKHDVNPRALTVLAKRELEDDDQKAKRIALQDVVDFYADSLGGLD